MRVKYDKNMVCGNQVVAKGHFLSFFGLFLPFLKYDILSVFVFSRISVDLKFIEHKQPIRYQLSYH